MAKRPDGGGGEAGGGGLLVRNHHRLRLEFSCFDCLDHVTVSPRCGRKVGPSWITVRRVRARSAHSVFGKFEPPEINWSAMGNRDRADAFHFMQALRLAIDVAIVMEAGHVRKKFYKGDHP